MVGFEPGTNRLQVLRTLATKSHCRQIRKHLLKDILKKLNFYSQFQYYKVLNQCPEAE